MEDQEELKPTPDTGDASTLDPLDRIERLLQGAEGGSENGDNSQDAPQDGETDGDGEKQATEPQISTSDLAKLLKLEDGALDLDEEGHAVFKTKVDGKEGTAKLQDLLKSYQLQEHVDRKSREAAEKEKALQARAQEVEQQFAQRLQYAENLANVAASQLLQEYQSINWSALEQHDAGQAALLRQKFQEKQLQLRGMFDNIQREKMSSDQKSQQAKLEELQREAEKLPSLIPEWKDAQVAAKERAEIRDWAIKAGYEASEIDNVSKAHHVAVLRKAMLADRFQASKPAIENKVRTAPKLVKPGQAQQDSKEQSLRNLKTSVQKSGGKADRVAEYLLARGIA